MHSHEGHSHADETSTQTTVQADSCGSGCGCGANEAQQSCAEGCGCSGGTGFDAVETAVMQGFLSGLYASTLPREKLAEYLTTMSQAGGSEFQGPATMLLQALGDSATEAGKPAHVALLETITGEPI